MPVYAQNYYDFFAELYRDKRWTQLVDGELVSDTTYTKTTAEVFALLELNLTTAVPPTPSEYVANNQLPPILRVYAPTLRELEARLTTALNAYAVAETRWRILARYRFVVQPAATLDFTLMPAVQSVLLSALAPPPRDVEAWGRESALSKAQPYAIALDTESLRTKLDRAMVDEFARRAGVRAEGTMATWFRAQAAEYDKADREMHEALDNFERVVGLLTLQSMAEAALQTQYEPTLGDIVAELQSQWRTALAAATSMADLQTRITPAVWRAVHHTDDVALNYAANVPKFVPSDRVPAAPTSRDSAELFYTPIGLVVALLGTIAVRHMTRSDAATVTFTKTVQPVIEPLPVAFGERWHALDSLQSWMERYGAIDTQAAYRAVKRLG